MTGLLFQIEAALVDKSDPRKVILKSLSLVVEDRDDVVIDLTEELATIKTKSFTIQEGVKFRIKMNCVVYNTRLSMDRNISRRRTGLRFLWTR